MELVRRLARVINFRYILYAVIIAVLVYVLTTPIIVDPLIAFLFAGIIPGTDVVLSPETVLMVLTDMFGLMVVGILIGWLIRRRLLADIDFEQLARQSTAVAPESRATKTVRRLQTRAAIRQAAHKSSLAVKQSAGRVQPRSVSALARLRQRAAARAVEYPLGRYIAAVLATAGLLLASAALTVLRYGILALITIAKLTIFALGMLIITTQFLIDAMLAGVAQIGRLLLAAGALLVKYGTWTLVFIIVLLGTIIDMSIRLGRFGWKHALPHLRNLDAWLEVKYQHVSYRAAQYYKRHGSLHVLTTIVRDSVTSLRHFIMK